MIDSAIAWNNQEKLIEANALFEGLQSEFVTWGVKPKTMLDMQYTPEIDGETPAFAGAKIMAKKIG